MAYQPPFGGYAAYIVVDAGRTVLHYIGSFPPFGANEMASPFSTVTGFDVEIDEYTFQISDIEIEAGEPTVSWGSSGNWSAGSPSSIEWDVRAIEVRDENCNIVTTLFGADCAPLCKEFAKQLDAAVTKELSQ